MTPTLAGRLLRAAGWSPMQPPAPTPDPASFRDPAGRVVHHEGRVFRALTPVGAAAWQDAEAAALELMDAGLLARTSRFTDDPALPALQAAHPQAEAFLEHEALPLLTYPAEWTTGMLADAALLTLEIQSRLLKHKLSLQDATAYNVAFVHGKPVFLDTGSIVRPARLDVWYALGQFQRMFLYPLMLARRGILPGTVFTSHLDGLTPRVMARALGRLGWLHPGRLFSVYLPAWLEGVRPGSARPTGDNPTGNADVQRAILNANRRRISRLRESLRPRGVWVDYRNDNSYSSTAETAKQERVEAFGLALAGGTFIDLGANTGTYSRILARHGRVIAADADHDALEVFYREARRENLQGIEFVHANLANPTPGIGFMNLERPPLLARLKGDGAVALALCHHLLVSAGLTMPQVATLLSSVAPRLLVEFVPPHDPMFRRLTAGRQDLWQDLDEAAFTAAFAACGMACAERTTLPDVDRVLLEFIRA